MYVLQIESHSPESCPTHNMETKKVTRAVFQRWEPLMAQHGVKMLGWWTDLGTHTGYAVYDVPSLDAFWAYLAEPELAPWISFNTVETKVVAGQEETQALLLG